MALVAACRMNNPGHTKQKLAGTKNASSSIKAIKNKVGVVKVTLIGTNRKGGGKSKRQMGRETYADNATILDVSVHLCGILWDRGDVGGVGGHVELVYSDKSS